MKYDFFCKFHFSYEISYEIFGNKETLIIGMDHINLLLITSITHINPETVLGNGMRVSVSRKKCGANTLRLTFIITKLL